MAAHRGTDPAPRCGRDPRDATVARRLAPHLLLAGIALLFCAPYLAPGRLLLPTDPRGIPPWDGAAAERGEPRGPSNDLMADALVLTLPARAWNHDALRAGRIPHWNDLIFGGYPHLAMIQNNALYPPVALLDLGDPARGMAWAIALHLALAGSLALIFLRASGVGSAGALVGAVAFELNGTFLVRASSPSYVFSGAWLPLLLLGARAVARGGGWRAGMPLALGTALCVLGGHPQVALLCVAAAGVLAISTVLAAEGGPGRLAAVLARCAALVALGVALDGFTVLPFVELVRESARTPVPLAEYLGSAPPVAALAQAFLPDVFGHPVDGTYWLRQLAPLLDGVAPGQRFWPLNYSGENAFTGVAPLVLAALALARPRRRTAVAALAALALGSLAVLFVRPLLALAWAVAPGFSSSRPDRILLLWTAVVALLAGHGADAAIEGATRVGDDGGDPPGRSFARPAALALLAILLASALPPLLPGIAGHASAAAALVLARQRIAALPGGAAGQFAAIGVPLALAAALVGLRRRGVGRAACTAGWIALVALPNLAFGWRFNPAQPPPVLGRTPTERAAVARPAGTRIARLLEQGPRFPANVPQLLAIDDANGASAAGLDRYVAVVEAFDPGAVSKMKYFPAFRSDAVTAGPLLDLLSVGVLVADREVPPPWQPLGRDGVLHLYANPRAMPRARLVGAVRRAAGREEALRLLATGGVDLRSEAVVEADGPVLGALGDSGTPALDGATAAIVATAPERVDVAVRSPRPAVLVTSDVAYPGWDVSVDGRAATMLVANGAFRAVEVPAGEHRVAFAFVPRSFRAGLAVSALAALLLLAAGLRERAADRGGGRRSRRNAPPPARRRGDPDTDRSPAG